MIVNNMFAKTIFVEFMFVKTILSTPFCQDHVRIFFNFTQFEPILSSLTKIDQRWSNMIQFNPNWFSSIQYEQQSVQLVAK